MTSPSRQMEMDRFQNNFTEIFLDAQMLKILWYLTLVVLYHVCSNEGSRVENGPATGTP